MAISINWPTGVISVPRADMTLIQSMPTEIRELDLDWFRLQLKSLEDDTEGMPFPKTHTHNTEVSLGGLTYARVVEILDPYTITFEDGQYAVSLVGANSNVGDKTNVNQVSVRSNNAAGLISTPLIEYSSFGGGVTIDVVNGTDSSIFPAGTPIQPCKTLTNVQDIFGSRGFNKVLVIGDLTLPSGVDFDDTIFEGESPSKTTITITEHADVVNSEFYEATVQGTLDGDNVLKQCELLNISYVEGLVQNCILNATITLSGSSRAFILDCWSGVASSGIPTIDLGGTGSDLAIRNYTGDLRIGNKTGNEEVFIDMSSGQICICDTVASGVITMRGVAKWTNEKTYAGGATINSELITYQDTQALSFENNEVWINVTNGYSGTAYPRGTTRMPSNNIVDALTIAEFQGINKFNIAGMLTIPSGIDVSYKGFSAVNGYTGQLYLQPGCITTDIGVRKMGVFGTFNGRQYLENCSLFNAKNLDGNVERCVLVGTLSVDINSSNSFVSFTDCFTSKIEEPYPTIDFQGSGIGAYFTNYTGAIKLTNKTGDDPAWVNGNSTPIIIDDSVTGGLIYLGGFGSWVNRDDYSGGANIINQMQNTLDLQRDQYEDGIHLDFTGGVAGTYHPIGTAELPVSNWTDFFSISSARNIKKIYFENLQTIIPSGVDLTSYKIYGNNAFNTQVIVQDGAVVNQMEIDNCFVTGHLGAGMVLRDCWAQDINGFGGVCFNSMIAGTITIASGQTPGFLACYGDSRKYGIVTIDAGYADSFTVRRFNGDLVLTNKQGGNPVSLDVYGEVTIDDSCSAGEITVGGVGRWVNRDTYTGGSTIIDNFATDANVIQASGESVSIRDFQGEAGSLTSESIWAHTPRSLTQAVAISGVPQVNIVQVSGVPVSINDFVGEASSLTTTGIANAVWDSVMDAGYTAEETMKIMLAALAGKLSGAAGTTIRIRDVNDTKDRIVATVDEDGNRAAITLDAS